MSLSLGCVIMVMDFSSVVCRVLCMLTNIHTCIKLGVLVLDLYVGKILATIGSMSRYMVICAVCYCDLKIDNEFECDVSRRHLGLSNYLFAN